MQPPPMMKVPESTVSARPLINPSDIEITGSDGVVRNYRLGSIPYLDGGREIASQFVPTATPKIGDYPANEALSQKMFSFIAFIDGNGKEHILSTKSHVNNFVPDFKTGIQLEYAMLEKCLGFSVASKLRESRQGWKQNLPAQIIKTLTQLLEYLQTPDNAHSTNSEPSTAQKM